MSKCAFAAPTNAVALHAMAIQTEPGEAWTIIMSHEKKKQKGIPGCSLDEMEQNCLRSNLERAHNVHSRKPFDGSRVFLDFWRENCT